MVKQLVINLITHTKFGPEGLVVPCEMGIYNLVINEFWLLPAARERRIYHNVMKQARPGWLAVRRWLERKSFLGCWNWTTLWPLYCDVSMPSLRRMNDNSGNGGRVSRTIIFAPITLRSVVPVDRLTGLSRKVCYIRIILHGDTSRQCHLIRLRHLAVHSRHFDRPPFSLVAQGFVR